MLVPCNISKLSVGLAFRLKRGLPVQTIGQLQFGECVYPCPFSSWKWKNMWKVCGLRTPHDFHDFRTPMENHLSRHVTVTVTVPLLGHMAHLPRSDDRWSYDRFDDPHRSQTRRAWDCQDGLPRNGQGWLTWGQCM